MADLVANTYNQATGMKDSFLDQMRLVAKDKTPLFTMLPTSSAVQRTHTWYYDVITTPNAQNKAVEGSISDTDETADFSEGTNYCQIVKVEYAISGTQAATDYKGIGNYVAYQKSRAMKSAAIATEYALTNGTGATGASATAREMRGMAYWATAQNTATGEASAFGTSTGQGVLDSVLKAIYEDGEEANMVLLSPTNKALIDGWTNKNTRYQDITKTTLTNLIDVYRSSFGTVEMVMSTVAGDTNVYAFDKALLYVAYLRRFKSEDLAKTGDRIPFHVIGEMTMECRNPNGTGAVILS
jgi:hypothetical protein